MSYQVLARKWRPGRFGDLVGQAHVLKSLTHALDNDRLHHAYLFTGTRGVGKTTLARILARCLNCEQGVSSEPCGECGACREIAEGRFIDLIEVDAASRTKVEDTRDLLENVQYAPSHGRYKIYLIDEVHMLSNHSFNALLKTLEEPPPHVMFLLATTDPQKLPITVLSRCLQFNLKRLSPQLIEEYLKDILQREGLAFEESALWHIATSAAGSMRDALTLLDQAISFCEGKVTEAGVGSMLGTPDTAVLHDLVVCLAEQNAARLLDGIETMAQGAADFQQLLEGLLGLLHRIAIAQVLPDGVDNAYGDRDKVLELASKLNAEDVQLFYQIALKGRADLALATDTRAMFEMLLIRMLVFSPEGVPTMPAETSQQPPATGEQKKKPQGGIKLAGQEPGAQPVTTPRTEPSPEPLIQSATHSPASGPLARESVRTEPELTPEPDSQPGSTVPPATSEQPDSPLENLAVESPASRAEAANAEDLAADDSGIAARPESGLEAGAPQALAPEDVSQPTPTLNGLDDAGWIALVQGLGLGGIAGNILAHCVLEEAGGHSLRLSLDRTQSAVYGEDHRRRIEQALAAKYGSDLCVAIEIGEPERESPAVFAQRIRRETLERMRDEFEADANVRQLVERFGAQVTRETITGLSRRGSEGD